MMGKVRMTHARFLSAAALVLALGAAQPALAAGAITCPTPSGTAGVAAQLPTGDALNKPQALMDAVAQLKTQGVSPVVIVNDLIAAYCPQVAAASGMTDAQKTAAVNTFAARITRTVYSLEGADSIILDVSFPPIVVDAINTKAAAAGVTPEAWIQSTVNAALK